MRTKPKSGSIVGSQYPRMSLGYRGLYEYLLHLIACLLFDFVENLCCLQFTFTIAHLSLLCFSTGITAWLPGFGKLQCRGI